MNNFKYPQSKYTECWAVEAQCKQIYNLFMYPLAHALLTANEDNEDTQGKCSGLSYMKCQHFLRLNAGCGLKQVQHSCSLVCDSKLSCH